jgi:hypothetical protein
MDSTYRFIFFGINNPAMRLLTISLLALVFLIAGCLAPASREAVPAPESPPASLPENASVAPDDGSAAIASGNASVVTAIPKGDEPAPPLNVDTPNQSTGTPNQGSGPDASVPKGILFGGGYMLALDDISVSGQPSPCGIFSVRYAENASVISNLAICEGASAYWTSPGNHRYRILVVKAAAGYTEASKWADVRIFG